MLHSAIIYLNLCNMAVKLLLIDADVANSRFSVFCSTPFGKHLLSSLISVSSLTSFSAHKGTLVH